MSSPFSGLGFACQTIRFPRFKTQLSYPYNPYNPQVYRVIHVVVSMREKNKNKNKYWVQILSIFSYYYLPWEKKRRGGGGGGEGRKVSVCHAPVSRINVHGMCQ